MGFFDKLKKGLAKTRDNVSGLVGNVFKKEGSIDDDFYDELEEALIIADVGMQSTEAILGSFRKACKEQGVRMQDEGMKLLKQIIADHMRADSEFLPETPAIILVAGVNGVGKTTSIGKLACILKSEGKKVMLAAADTFRAAAADQLEVWAQRNSIDIIKHAEGADPAAVVFDAIAAAKSRNVDVLICDTAGRLHNKKNLMDELSKIERIINREYSQAYLETLLVIDATTGQNAIEQAKVFKECIALSGIILTKLDGTAKGGVVVAVKNLLGIPVRLIGVGEGIDDMQRFDADEFASALIEG